MRNCCWRRSSSSRRIIAPRARNTPRCSSSCTSIQQARRELERLLEDDPDNRPYYQSLYATASVGLGEHERAIALYRDLLAGDARTMPTCTCRSRTRRRRSGQREEAIESYRRAAACRPNFGDAYWSLANLKTYRFTDEELARLRAAQAEPTVGLVDRYHLCFALGKALEDRATMPNPSATTSWAMR